MNVDVVEISCCNCGCSFWITAKHNKELLTTKKPFFCPNGHSQEYVGKSDRDKFLEEQKRSERLFDRVAERDREIETLKRRVNGYKGQLAKAKKKEPLQKIGEICNGEE